MPMRDSILAAVDTLVRERKWTATTMSDVARGAGVSRQTVYNEFGTRRELVAAYVVREISALLDSVESLVRAQADDARAALADAFALVLTLALDGPLVQIVVGDAEGADIIGLLTTTGLALATERIGGLIAEVWPTSCVADAQLVAASLARLAISHALAPSMPPDEAAAAVTRLFGPFIDDVLG